MLAKQELLGQLTNAQNNYVLGLAAMSLFAEPSSLDHLHKSQASFGSYTVKFDQVGSLLSSEATRQDAMKEFLTMLLRALLKESFEIVRDYAEKSKQDGVFRSQSWYQFARMIRNCISHDFHFRFTPHDMKKLPITWNNRTIEAGLANQPLPIAFLGYGGTWELFQEMERFAVTLS
ncbi:hypothetical protein [Rhizobacter sp. OV335]|uniref:hypothetical protein n=1 Tax=Rhizobacter sp. OV335 TaxID=1500264 RepID=UPI0011610B70|nr:hypothetical protein [Rhizobacter sp. OV335]